MGGAVCRLFGLTAGTVPIQATFWLLDAPDSLEAQSYRNVDGSGIGFFGPDGAVVLDKQPEPAFGDTEFIHEARHASSTAFVAHVRLATTGGRQVVNTHPFAMDGRIMAHNGGFGEVERIETQLGSYADRVLGDTDSERYFALITRRTAEHGGDVGAGIIAAAQWIAANLPVTSLNAVVAEPDQLWALRYPDQHALHILKRSAGPGTASIPPGLHVRSATSSVHVPALASAPSVVVASEQLDGESGWRMLAPGELMHVRPDLTVESAVVMTEPPARLVQLSGRNPNIDS